MITPSFRTFQTVGAPESFSVTDNSTGTDVNVVKRRLFIQRSDGSYIVTEGVVTNYLDWELADTTLLVENILEYDQPLSLTMQLLDVSNTVLYTKTTLVVFTLYTKTFFYSLTQYQSSTPGISQDTVYFSNKARLWMYIVSAENAINVAGDISGSLHAIEAATHMVNNENSFF